MKSKLVLLGGPVGVGKTTAMAALKNRLPKSALLEADDVWRVSDDIPAEAGRNFAHANLDAVIGGYFDAGVETCFVSWVFARPELYKPVIENSARYADIVLQLYLVASPQTLARRIRKRNEVGSGTDDVDALIEYSLSRLAMIEKLPFDKIDTTELTATEVAGAIVQYVESRRRSRLHDDR